MRVALRQSRLSGQETSFTTFRTPQQKEGSLIMSEVRLMGPEGRQMNSVVARLKELRGRHFIGDFNFAFHTHTKVHPEESAAHQFSLEDIRTESDKRTGIICMATVPTYSSSPMVMVSFLFAKIPREFDWKHCSKFMELEGESLTLELQKRILTRFGVKVSSFDLPFHRDFRDFGFIPHLQRKIVSDLK